MRTALSLGLGVALALIAPAALAQDPLPPANPAPPPGDGALPPPKVTTQVTTTVAPAAAKPAEDEGVSDHEKVVNHLGVGYLGLTSLPLAGGNGIPTSVNAPVIGVRYWLNEKMGLDLGLGFALTSGSSEVVNSASTVTTDRPSVFGGAIHGGVPLVLAHQKHFTFLAVPELNLGFTSATYKPTAPNGAAAAPEESHSGFLLGLGARVGAEIQFGFIGIPQLSLQATVGARMQYERTKVSSEVNGVTNSASNSVFGIGTSVQSDPWAIFANNISAIYYLP